MGNQSSFPCCQVPRDKYEGANGALDVDAEKAGALAVYASNGAQAKVADGNAPTEKASEEASQEGPQEQKVVGTFATSNPLEVAPELAPQQGLPYQFHICGPPPPPCDDLRLRTINALKTAGSVRMDADAIDAPPDPEIASILKLVQSIFEAPAALVALFDDRRIFIRDAEGAFKRGDFPWRWSFCGWTMASKNDQIMVIPDATKDARFCNNAMVKSGPGVRFYCGTPLMASNGHRIGTLCFADVKPRDFDASRCVVLNNLAELVVRHLEKDIALQLRAHDNNTLMAAYGNLRRTLDCFDHCVALVDTGTVGWRILFVNNPCCKALGIERDSLQGSYLSRLLTDDDGSMMPTDEQQEAAIRGGEFQVMARLSKVVVEEILDDGKDGTAAGGKTGAAGQRFVVTFRPASREDLDQGQIPIGVPNWIPVTPKKLDAAPGAEGSTAEDGKEAQPAQRRTDTLYFMLLQDAAKLEAERAAQQAKAAAEAKAAMAANASSAGMSTAPSSLLSFGLSQDKELSQPPESITGLTMGHLLGKGAYGSVYYGTWYGSPVAVKIIEEELPPGAESVAPPIEAILSKELRHPHVVATLRCARRIIGPSGGFQALSASTAHAHSRRPGGLSGGGGMGTSTGQAGRLNSIDTFSDDSARVSQAMSNMGGSANSSGVRKRSGGSSGLSGGTASKDSMAAGPSRSCLSPSGVSTPCVTDAGACTPSTAGASTLPTGAASEPSAATDVAVDATSEQQRQPVIPGQSPSQLSSQTGSQAAWPIINLAGGGSTASQHNRHHPGSAAHGHAGGTATAADADTAVAALDGAVPVAGGSGPPEPEGSTDNSEAYDDFDIGRDSNMSPFMLPPGSAQGPGGGGAGGGGGGPTGLLGHSGHSGASDKWTTDEVLIRHQTWLIMEYCDRGCLQDAVDRGWLRTSPAIESSAPRMDAVLATAVELASALSFLHSKDIVHGDLSAWNVMLCTSGATSSQGGRNFVAKIADFGLARHLDIRTKIQTRTYGTLTHMPAETLRDGVISKATDVYSLGVLLWQLYTSSRPWAGLRHGQIIVMVVTQGARLRFPPGCPPAYEALANACMDPDPRCRPAVEAVLGELDSIRKSVD